MYGRCLNIVISGKLIKRLESLENSTTCLLGWRDGPDTIVCYTCASSDDFVPQGIEILAYLCVSNSADIHQIQLEFERIGNLKEDDILYLVYSHQAWRLLSEFQLQPIEVTIQDIPLVSSTRHLVRICGALPFLCKWDKNEENFRNNVFDSLNDMKKFSFSFQLKDSLLILHSGESHPVNSKLVNTFPQPKGPTHPTVLQLSYHVTGENNNTPIIFMRKHDTELVKLPQGDKLRVDVLAIVDLTQPLPHIHQLLEKAIWKQLSQLGNCLIEFGLHLPVPYHFIPKPCGHPVTIIYPEGISEDQLRDRRIRIHNDLLVPLDRPYFQRHNDFLKNQREEVEERLINPHLKLESSDQRYLVATVAGDYAYHHYLQDGIDDSGWGCAYRSLQTIVSWYRLQGYTSVPVPSHRTIQQALVALGDKPPDFIGSRQWIGSQEIVYTLQHLLKVDSKVMFISSGSELEEKARELIHHFENQGTPVMIGGGTLAHTILGVKLDTALGHVEYLVLDPHYTGPDNLTTVLKKGWCGWKGIKFWNANSFYNLCLPQKPSSV